jgi:hypothetical protein
MTRFFLLPLLFIISPLSAQENEVRWFPDHLLIQPFAANFLEPRAGFQFVTGDNDLRLDIGASKDLIQCSAENAQFSIGADFFTYTRLRGEDEFHFPVDAVDYLFGLNAGWKKNLSNSVYGVRTRLSHISAHMVDGHFEPNTQTWRDNRKPIVYSREFIEAFPFYEQGNVRLYAGITYLFHVVPRDLRKVFVQAGGEYFFGAFCAGLLTPFASVDLKTSTAGSLRVSQTALAGIKFGDRARGGARCYLVYYNGKNAHGEYYNIDEQTVSFGVTLDF